MLISIIIRTKNEEKWLKATLNALKCQTYNNYEVVLVDNNSKDRTVDIARSYGCKKVISLDSYNPSKALNLGVKQADGDICIFLSAHCVPANEYWIEELVSPIVSGTTKCSYGRQIPTSMSNPDNTRDLLIAFGKESIIQKLDFKFHNANSAIKRSHILTNPFDEKLTNVEDWHWAAAAIDSGEYIAYVPSAVVFHHHGLNQHSDEITSFRASPVANLLTEAYKLEGYEEPFFDYTNYDGLLICSSNQKQNLAKLINNAIPDHVIISGEYQKIQTSKEVCFVRKSKNEYDFLTFLKNTLLHAEEKYNKIFDYVCFVDFAYHEIDTDIANRNINDLFQYWAEVSSAARRVKGKMFTEYNLDRCTSSDIFPTYAEETNSIELLLGQGGAFRSTILRTENNNNINYKITKIVEQSLSFKEKEHSQ